jgi:hypothetical protein
MDIKTAEALGMEDNGKWLPFIFDMDIIDAAKMSSDDPESSAFNSTTIFTKNGDTFIIDTHYKEFFAKFIEYNALNIDFRLDEEDEDGDINL